VICDGFLKLESLDFWMTPSPKHSLPKSTAEIAGVEIRLLALMISTRLNAIQYSLSTPVNTVQHTTSTAFNQIQRGKIHCQIYPA
jgi:hypothetical protein